jgi:hypothetical protein
MRPFACLVALQLLAPACSTGDLGDQPFRCGKLGDPDPNNPGHMLGEICPSGYICSLTLGQCLVTNNCVCVRNSGASPSSLTIPKTSRYSGPHMNPGIPPCNETDGNNGFQTAFVVGDSTGKFDGLEICPSGDVDVYSLNINAGEYGKLFIGYQIAYGDLDLEILDSKGNVVGIDNDATRDNACVTIPRGGDACPCTYYAIVDGGYGAVNRYSLQFSKSSMPLTCSLGTTSPHDLGAP